MKRFLLIILALMVTAPLISYAANESSKNDNSGNSSGANTLIIIDETSGEIFNLGGNSSDRSLNVAIKSGSATNTIKIQPFTDVDPVCYSIPALSDSGTTFNPAATAGKFLFVNNSTGQIWFNYGGSTAATPSVLVGLPLLQKGAAADTDVTITKFAAYNPNGGAATACVKFGGQP